MQLSAQSIRVSSLLQELTLSLSEGQLTGIIGPNGAGKTTLLRCLSGDLAVHAGEIVLAGIPLQRWSSHERAERLAYLPQSTSVTFAFTVEELVGLRARSEELREQALDTMELPALRERPLTSLSGGEQRRAAIARVLAQGAPCLLLDEPLTHLDPRYQRRLLLYLQAHCQQGGSAALVLHDLRLARKWCDRLALLVGGGLLAEGTPEELLTTKVLEEVFGVPGSFLA
ncbi:ABC transporter ATP-binding protein [Armatimonas rosea]|uniref:Iron complex transport system ATP-binding protein n=1 Tax=Armatimonas rosea TaxID=685828 RepID=A0A7W9SL41_ARMRO|nr:ABC transporter ATP-binding protein [Armatimonas rosea]MBB6048325.1 iron complex transport system ATP-binding protein [Armatimonas rosea]